ncbi:hypothetical protein GEV33_012864 [Tenebrio molitor]|uniref:Uncharacterized protein n=1 Tax=Tenebrio molitor TaxID=7067 RepID=A0A8J6HA05_TENMO|nr:hypothetical protein GEV33_012864 [Tenebrio molitor]
MDGLCILTKVYASFVKKFNVSNLEYQSVEARFAQSTDYGSYRIGNYYTDMHKLQKEIAIIQFLLDSLMSEVKRYGTFTLITEYMENLQNMREDEETLMEELREKSKLIDYIRCAHVKEKQLSSSVVTAYNNSIRETLRVYEEATEYALTEVNFVQKWQDARYEQNLLKLQLQESNFSSTAETMRWEIELEERCHEELEDYITESQQDYIDEIQIWMEQYEVALENKESQIYNMKMEIEKLNDEHERLQIDYDDRTREIEDWLEYKRKKEEEEKLLMLQTWAAMKIQVDR